MPLFRALGERGGGGKNQAKQRNRIKNTRWNGGRTDEDGSVLPLTRLCLLSLAHNMKDVWAKDYAEKYMDHYTFRHIMGPFSLLPGDLVEELMQLLCSRKQLSRAALHLLLVPQLRGLCLEKCPGLVTSALCTHIAARCQGLWSLDISGAQQLPSKVLSETLCCLPALRSLSLAGTPCDRSVIRTITHHCRSLRHLDVSCCHFLSPAALLPLGGGTFSPSGCLSCCTSTSKTMSPFCSAPLPPLPLSSLLALDIGFGEQGVDPVAAAAYLLLTLSRLERVAMEGLTEACCLIQQRQFDQTDEFTDREGVPGLREVWREWKRRQDTESGRTKREGGAAAEDDEDEEEESMLWEGCDSECEEDASKGELPSCSETQAEEKRRGRVSSGDQCLILRLKDVKGLQCDSLHSLGQLCPNIHSLSVVCQKDGMGGSPVSHLASGLQTWSGQLQGLSVHFPGPLECLLPALQVAGSSLVSLTMEGVQTSPYTPLLEVIRACPKLRELLISAEPPTTPQEQEFDEHPRNYQNLPRLPNLCSLTLKFSYEHSQMKPVMSWMALKGVLKCLLAGSPFLQKLSLVSLPCPLNCILQEVLHGFLHFANSAASPPEPLARLQHVDLSRTDVKMSTLKSIMLRNKKLKCVDVSYCWQISQQKWLECMTFSNVLVNWL